MVFVRKKEDISALPLSPGIRAALERGGIVTVGALIDALEEGPENLPPLRKEELTEVQRLVEGLEKGTQGFALAEWGAALPARRGKLIWSLDEEGVLTIRGTGAMPDCIPSRPAPWQDLKEDILTLQVEEGVTEVGAQAFRNCTQLRRVALASSVERIGMAAFAGCTALEEVNTPRRFRHVKEECSGGERRQTVSMGLRAFDGTPWAKQTYGDFYTAGGVLLEYFGEEQEVIIPEGVREIGPVVFENRTIRSVQLPQSLEVIRQFAFQGTGLRELTLPEGVKQVENRAFGETRELKSVLLLNGAAEIAPEAFAGTPVYSSSHRKPGRWTSLYSLASAKEARMEAFARLVVKRRSSPAVMVPDFCIGESLLKKVKRGDMVLRICLDEEEKRVKYVQAFAYSWEGYFTQLMYPCIKDGAVEIWRDSTTYMEDWDILGCDTSGLWPLDKAGYYRWYRKKYQPYDESEAPVSLLCDWLKKHPDYRVDTIEENMEQDKYRILVPC